MGWNNNTFHTNLNNAIKPHPCHNNTFHISLIKLLSHAPNRNYCWGTKWGFRYLFYIIKSNNIFLGANCIAG